MLTLNKKISLFPDSEQAQQFQKRRLDPSIWEIKTHSAQNHDDASALFKHLLGNDSYLAHLTDKSATPLDKNAGSGEQTVSAFIAQHAQKEKRKRADQAKADAQRSSHISSVDYRSAFLFKKSSF
jgi:hypothetical protein